MTLAGLTVRSLPLSCAPRLASPRLTRQVLPALMNEYRVPELNVQNGVLKSLSFLFEYIRATISMSPQPSPAASYLPTLDSWYWGVFRVRVHVIRSGVYVQNVLVYRAFTAKIKDSRVLSLMG